MDRATLRKAILVGGVALVAICGGIAADANRLISVFSDAHEFAAVSRVVFARGRLWLLHDDGSLASLELEELKPRRVETGGKTLDICRSGDQLLALIATSTELWRLQRWSSSGWSTVTSMAPKGEALATLACTSVGLEADVVTNKRLLQWNNANARVVTLRRPFQGPIAIGTSIIDGDSVWVGFNAGEWGGGLTRIDRKTGEVSTIEYNRSGKLCGGPLNAKCDPVTGIVSSPTKESCIVASVGLVHMLSHGRLVEVCDRDIRRVYFKSLAHQPPNGKLDDGEPSNTTAFFGLARSGDTMWALGVDGLYSFVGAKPPQFHPLPTFEKRGAYRVSFDVPGIVLVMTNVNQRSSLSGAVPMMTLR
jgi:hypothetical protein